MLELVPDGVCVVRAGFLEVPPEVVRMRHHLTLVAGCGGQDSSHDRVARLVIVVVGRSRGPLKALLGVVCGRVRWCLLVSAWGCLPASLDRVKHDCLIASGVLGGDAARLLEHVLEEVIFSTPARALRASLGQCTHATFASLAMSLGLVALALLP
jgi:hypothetical protein